LREKVQILKVSSNETTTLHQTMTNNLKDMILH